MGMKGKGRMGRPPKTKSNNDEPASFILSKELADYVRAYQTAMDMTSKGEAYRQMLRLGVERAKEKGILK